MARKAVPGTPTDDVEEVEVTKGPKGIKRLASRSIASAPASQKVKPAPDGEYTAVIVCAIANPDYNPKLPVTEQHQSPLTHIYPGDIVEVPTALSATDAGGLLAKGAIRETTDEDHLAHEIAAAENVNDGRYARTTLAGMPRER